jgi:small subunit ribosomal protein S20
MIKADTRIFMIMHCRFSFAGKLLLTGLHNSVKHTASLIKFRRILLATHKSAEKRDRQSVKGRERNVAAKSGIKTKVKSVINAVESKDKDASAKALKAAIPALAKAAVKGVIHKKNASRKISRLTRKINALQS